ncbi:hypothetical protein QQ045_021991 [Rhodiola kirilowii]
MAGNQRGSPLPSPAPTPYYESYPESYPGYFSGYYQQPPLPPPPARPYFDSPSSYGGPSAPVDYAVYDQKQRSSGELGVGAVSGAMGGLTLDEGVKYMRKISLVLVEGKLIWLHGMATGTITLLSTDLSVVLLELYI